MLFNVPFNLEWITCFWWEIGKWSEIWFELINIFTQWLVALRKSAFGRKWTGDGWFWLEIIAEHLHNFRDIFHHLAVILAVIQTATTYNLKPKAKSIQSKTFPMKKSKNPCSFHNHMIFSRTWHSKIGCIAIPILQNIMSWCCGPMIRVWLSDDIKIRKYEHWKTVRFFYPDANQ